MDAGISRRDVLVGAGIAGAGAAYGLRGLWLPDSANGASCLLQRETTEGPYYLDLDLVRRNIKGARRGIPLTLRFKVVNARTCRALRNAAVELWHADASGAYSGVSGNSGNWLRGIQRTNPEGRVRFETIFPGWYPGRTPHIHVKVFVSGREVHTGQVFFPTSALRAVYGEGGYRAQGSPGAANSSDGIYREAGKRSVVSLQRKGSRVSAGYNGSLTIGVRPP